MDLARRQPEYIEELARHHVGGHLKVAPEHTDPQVLELMKKPPIEEFEAFGRLFESASRKAGLEQYLVPYFIAGHPGCDLPKMIELACYLKRTGLRPQQVQDFLPTPGTLATCMYWTGIDPLTGRSVYVPRGARQRRLQRALLQYWKSENYFDVRAALREAGREDLIGDGPECLIPATPPVEARPVKAASSRSWPKPPTSNLPPPGGPTADDHFADSEKPAASPLNRPSLRKKRFSSEAKRASLGKSNSSEGSSSDEKGASPERNVGYRPGRKTARRRKAEE